MKRYVNALLAAAVAAFVSVATMIVMLPGGGLASQNNAYLPTTGTFSGLTAANTINNAIDALLTCNSGSAAPTNALGGSPKLGQCWIDTTSATLPIKKRYTGSAWVVEAVIDVTNGRWSPPIGGGTATLASASTADLCASPQAVQTISGTTTITAFGSNCVVGVRKTFIFSGILTLTHNATSLIIPGGLSKTTANGDVGEAVYLGSGNWRVVSYVPIAGTVVTSIAGNTGIFTLANGIDNSGNQIQLTAARRTLPTIQRFTSGTAATYTTPANVLWIRITLVGPGGGGSDNATAGSNGSAASTFSGGTLSAGAGVAGGTSGGNPVAGGAASGGNVANIAGGAGGGSTTTSSGAAGASCLGGAGAPGATTPIAPSANSGGGGGGRNTAGSGSAGGCVMHIINSPAATYTYTIGTGGAAGGSATAGAAGLLIVEEFYGS